MSDAPVAAPPKARRNAGQAKPATPLGASGGALVHLAPYFHPLDPAQRHAQIELLAYERAERRGFAPGHELDDWLAAEAEIDAVYEGEHFSGD